MSYITESVGTIIDVLTSVLGEGFSTGTEDTLVEYHNIIPYIS